MPLPLADAVRIYILNETARTGRVPQAVQIAAALDQPLDEIGAAIRDLAAAARSCWRQMTGRFGLLSRFARRRRISGSSPMTSKYWALCIWDALGVPAALHADAIIDTSCGDCGEAMTLEVRDGALTQARGVVHFGVPARRFWDNIAFT